MAGDRFEQTLDAAFRVFVTYGFKRSTMGDIADAAGISRPALYTRFRNKEDLFHAVAERSIGRALDQALDALASDARLLDRVLEAFERWVGDFVSLFHHSAHGRELMDVNHHLAGDVVEAAADRFRDALTRAFRRAATAGTIDLRRSGLKPADLVAMLVDASTGAKVNLVAPHTYRARMIAVLKVIDAATRPAGARRWSPKARG